MALRTISFYDPQDGKFIFNYKELVENISKYAEQLFWVLIYFNVFIFLIVM